jgi:hypothetical protein
MKEFLIASVLAFFTMGNVFAGDQDFTLINQTGYEIDRVYVSAASTSDWEEDILGQDSLGDGEHVNIRFSRGTKGCKFDLKVVYTEDDSEAVWDDIDLCTVESVTIHWNKKSGETTATFD